MRHSLKEHLGWIIPTVCVLYAGYVAGVSVDTNKIDPALIVSLCALFFTYYQFYASQRHNRLSVKPLIMVGYPISQSPTVTGKYKIGISLLNAGLGPANIFAFQVKLGGRVLSANELISAISRRTGLEELYQQHKIIYDSKVPPISEGIFLKQDSEHVVLSIEFWSENGGVTHKELDAVLGRLYSFVIFEIDVCFTYSSIYGDDVKKIETKERNERELPRELKGL